MTQGQDKSQTQAHALLPDAVEALATGLMHFDQDGGLLTLNRSARQTLYGPHPLPRIGTPLAELVHELAALGRLCPGPDAVSPADRFLTQAARPGASFSAHWADGRVLEFCAQKTALGGTVISVQDLTEAIQAQTAAHEANELVRTIVDASPTTFLVSKVETGEVVYLTSASRERFGEISSTLSFFLRPEDRQTYLDALLPTGSLTDYPVKFRRGDGSIMDGLTSARVVDYRGEKMIVSATRDITEFLAVQAELVAQREAAAQNEKLSALGELLAGVAHELSNPMSVVLGYAMMLRDQVAQDEKALRRAERVAEAAQRCAKILRMFLAMARQRPIALEPQDIGALVQDGLEIPAATMRSLGTRLDLQIAADLPPVEADGDQIIQVVTNLATNAAHAVEHQGAEGTVRVAVQRGPKGWVHLEVADSGAGIPDEIRNRIFEPFFTTKDVGVGTGVGLAFCQRTVAAHGGELTVTQAPEGGALFRVALPEGQGQTAPGDEARGPAADESALPILVLDDEPHMREMVQDLLTEAGYAVETFEHGAQALDRCDQQRFGAILADMRMPGMTGQEFYQTLAARLPDQAQALIFLTGDTMNPETVAFLEHSGRPYLEKPIVPAVVLRQVTAVIERAGL